MGEPVWSRHFAQEIANALGYPCAETAADSKDEKLRQEAEELIEQITEDFRYLPLEPTNWAINLAGFLGAKDIDARDGGWIAMKLREVREYVAFLRTRHGTGQPADEEDYWTDEDRRDLQRAGWRRLEEEDPWPEDGYLSEEQGNAEAG